MAYSFIAQYSLPYEETPSMQAACISLSLHRIKSTCTGPEEDFHMCSNCYRRSLPLPSIRFDLAALFFKPFVTARGSADEGGFGLRQSCISCSSLSVAFCVISSTSRRESLLLHSSLVLMNLLRHKPEAGARVIAGQKSNRHYRPPLPPLPPLCGQQIQ
jgi:hypothetical protein